MQISSFVACVFCLALSPFESARAAELTLEQKVGQMMVWSFSGQEFTANMESVLSHYQPGGLIYFKRNIRSPDQISALNRELRRFAARKMKVQPLLMVDQEGGVVTRIRVATPLPSALALGKTEDSRFIETFAFTKGELLALLGFNVNLAPVLDISNPRKDSFIGNRTFGEDPDIVSEMALAYAKGLTDAGVLPTAKHFPGHGGTRHDSHKTVPKKDISLDDLQAKDLVPFARFAQAGGPRIIMTAHLALPKIDPSGLPATYSTQILQGLLRDKMKYDGVIITDDLEMNGASISDDIGERAVRAVLAGNDMLILAGSWANQRRAYRAIVDAVRSGRIPAERVDESVRRILAVKSDALAKSLPADRRKIRSVVRRLEHLSKQAMNKNFRYALESNTRRWPAMDAHSRVQVLGASHGFYRSFKDKFVGKADFVRLTPSSLRHAAAKMARENVSVNIYYASGSQTARWLDGLAPEIRAKTIVVNCNHPGEILSEDDFLTILNLHSHSPESGAWLAEAMNPRPNLVPLEPDVRTPAGREPEPNAPPEDGFQ